MALDWLALDRLALDQFALDRLALDWLALDPLGLNWLVLEGLALDQLALDLLLKAGSRCFFSVFFLDIFFSILNNLWKKVSQLRLSSGPALDPF